MSNTDFIPDEQLVSDLRSTIDGDIVTPADRGYDEARSLWNGAIDRRPSVIIVPASVGDVATGIAVAREHDLPLAVRGGGHHVTGAAMVEDGLVIDLSGMDDVTIDPGARIATVGPGARVSDVFDPAQEHGLSPVVGSAAQNGIAGSTLAGGIGWIRRKFGLGVDNLRSVELVTVDGDVVTAGEGHNSDLFWAVRGGGPNVGIVTRFEMELVPVGPRVAIVQTIYPIEAADAVLRAYRAYASEAPDEVTTLIVLMRVPPLPPVPEAAVGAPVVIVFGVYAGDVEVGNEVMAPLRDLAEPLMDMSGPQPLAAVHDVARELFPDGRRYSWHSIYADELGDDAIETLTGAFARAPSAESELTIYHLGGAIAEVDSDDTAFGFRDAAYLVSVGAAWDDPEADDANVEWARGAWETLRGQPCSIDGFYPGFPGCVDGEERARMAYGANHDRLAAIKAEYDPDNRFRHNLNVEPAVD